MSDNPSPEFGDELKSAAAKDGNASLFDRLRNLFFRNQVSVRDDIEGALDEAANEADFTPQERTILKNVLGLHDVRVADVMVPRADIVATSIEAPLYALLQIFRSAGHSRLPVYGDTLDDPRGMVHIRDFVDLLTIDALESITTPEPHSQSRGHRLAPIDMARPLSSTQFLRPLLFAPPSMPALDLLVKMQASRTHMALVIDEYGGTDGLVSIEDVVEAIVGDIEDEHDIVEPSEILRASDGSYIAEARASLELVAKTLGADFSRLTENEDIDTIGGLITARAGRVPGRGEIVSGIGAFEYEILDADPRRIKRVKIHHASEKLARNKEAQNQPPAGHKT